MSELDKRPRGRPRYLLAAGTGAYLLLIFGVMLWRGISIEPEFVVLALLLIAIALGRGRSFIVDWIPFLVLFLAYEEMRGFAAKTGFAPHDLSVLERFVFGGTIPTLVLQHAFYQPGVVSPQDVIAMFFYFMHFPLPIVVGFYFWYNRREHYWRFISALIVMCFIAFATYLFFPSAPPWYQFPGDVVKINDKTVAALWGGKYFVSQIYTSFNPNRFAAFPSLHAAFPALAAVYAWNRYRGLAIALIAWSACVVVAIVYLGEHYAVDAIAGYVYVAVATVIVELVARRLERRPTPATPSA